VPSHHSITVRLSDEAIEALHHTAAAIGVSTTALIETIALMLKRYPDWSEYPDWPQGVELPPLAESSLAKIARQIDFDRRQRGV
jgi:hypothetical protein